MASKDYWADRTQRAQQKLTNKNTKKTEEQLKKYYRKAMQRTIDDFESTYDKLLATVEAGKKPTPADLYKLDKYWRMQGQLKQRLEKLGETQITVLSKNFELNFFEVYYSIDIDAKREFTRISRDGARQLIISIWCADGLDFKQRIWGNVDDLINTLNDGLLDCVITGKKTSQLKKTLRERFGVSYNRADTIVRTEMSHIQNTAAQQRYKDYGITQFEVWADKDERLCDVCGKLHRTKYGINDPSPVPVHPRCRCSIIPVVD